jgi:peptidoglycan hydrolase-like protein with peptidoglycan-binding domain
METLAYLHLAQEYEAFKCLKGTSARGGLNDLNPATEFTVSGQGAAILLGIACSTWLLILPNAAWALVLQQGDRGADVSYLQTLLRDAGYFNANDITGYYGSITEDAVRQFQRDNSLSVDGIAGDRTFAALENRFSSGQSSDTARPVSSSSVSPATFNRDVLQFGSSGEEVRELQRLLTDAGYLRGPVTGYYGTVTEDAVLRFQRDNSLRIDGIADAQTLAALNSFRSGSSGEQRALQRGDRGNQVLALQYALIDFGYYPGPLTGVYGPLTEDAVRKFQSSRGIVANGVAGPETLAPLGLNRPRTNVG